MNASNLCDIRFINFRSIFDFDLVELCKKKIVFLILRKDKSNGIYYFNQETGESSWVHPVDASLKEFIRRSKRREKDAADTGSPSVVSN